MCHFEILMVKKMNDSEFSMLASFLKSAGGVLCLLLAFSGPRTPHAQESAPMPLAIHERLWSEPGPEQSGRRAPKLLIVYPLKNGPVTDLEAMRYAGRVEPEDARVTLNGEEVKVWPGGVFTGLRPLRAPSETWQFTASARGRETTVERVVRRLSPPVPAPEWPLTFFRSPVSPGGSYWLRPFSPFKVTLYASPGQKAQVRIGESGAWKDMKQTGRDPERGGVYQTSLVPPPPLPAPRLQTVYFRLLGTGGGQGRTEQLTSRLKIGTIPNDRQMLGEITSNLGTYFKDQSSPGRWGNWLRGTLFPVLEGRSARLRTGFGRGESGWVEAEQIKLLPDYQSLPMPRLGEPLAKLSPQVLTLAWPGVKRPVACVFYLEPAAGGGATLRVSLPGAAGLKPFSRNLGHGSGFTAVQGGEAQGKTAAWIRLATSEGVWGYGMRCDEKDGLRIIVRLRPRLAGATAQKPLAGLRVMLDAGHGGVSFGERGPSGLLEKDLNLVQAAWLEHYLTEMGAEVRQVRRADVDVELDARVDMALAWNPDLFISLHHNSVPYDVDPAGDSGPKVFFHYPGSQALATLIERAMTERFAPERAPRVLKDIFRVNRNVSICPSVLVESAFVCNPEDEYKLRQTETLKASARTIAAAVRQYVAGQ